MKQNWEYKKLGDVCVQICDGSHAPPQGIEFSDYPMLSSKNIFFDSLNYDEPRFLTKDDFDAENKRTNISDGDVLLTIVGTVGRSCVVVEPFKKFVLQRSVAVLKPKKTLLISRFLMYKMTSLSSYFEREARGVAQKGIYLKQLSQLPIPVPPLAEQQRIVAELDLLTGIIDKLKAQLKELDTLAQSIFYDMFGDPIENPKGWEVKKISDVATVKIGPFGSLLHAKDYVNGGHPVINPIHLNLGKIFADESFTVDDAMYEQMQAYKLQLNDVVFGRRGDIGRCALVEKGQEGYLCGTGSLFVRFNEIINPTFSIAALMHESITDYLVKKAKGATMLNINCGIVEDIPIILPPLALQQTFADKIQSIERQKLAIKTSIADTQKLLDYTMDKYFG